MVLVSVVMNCYNQEKYIAEAMKSVLNQTFKDLELIITDCSTDNSKHIIAAFQQKDPRVHAIFCPKKVSISESLNSGLDKVDGKYVSFLDSDDLWVENKLEKQLETLRRDETKIVWSEGEIINGEGTKTGLLVSQHLHAPVNKNGNLFEPLLREHFVFRQSMIFKAEYTKKLRFDPALEYVNDHRFLVNLAVNHEFLFMPEVLAKYRLHGKNITLQKDIEWAKDKIRIRRYFLDEYGGIISRKAKADINYQIGFYLSRLGRRTEAKKYYLQALKIDHTHFNSALYTAYALTTGEGIAGQLMLKSYNQTAGLLEVLAFNRSSFRR